MRAGKLRHRVEIQDFVPASPGYTSTGEPDGSWQTLTTVWASVDPVNGREPFLAQAHLSEVTTKISLRYHAAVSSKMRAVYAGKIYDIKAVLNWNERNIELQLLCTEGLNDG